MSASLKDALMIQMQASSGLSQVLAKDPNDPAGIDLAIYPSRMNAVQAPVYPCLTFREQSDVPDGRFRPQPAGNQSFGPGNKGVAETFFDFESWTNGTNTRPLESIRDALDALFHQQAFPVPATGLQTASVFFCERLTGSLDNYDDVLHIWYGLMRYRFRVQYL